MGKETEKTKKEKERFPEATPHAALEEKVGESGQAGRRQAATFD